ncbi:Splicing factor u2af large subunit [Oopsacas minuta]|uniref:Splicing factor u2af large subunit n=1 Tax=Oopsacas minuta TaxID=111878 RepID=A0AAV7JXV5_9METZ|nr:Splicing factor u2af large subunit [Oopsacas minuta]
MSGQQIYFEDFTDTHFDPTTSRISLYPADNSVIPDVVEPMREQRDVTPTDNPIRRLERLVEQEEGREEQKRKQKKENERAKDYHKDSSRDRDKNRKKDRRSPEDNIRKKSRKVSHRDRDRSEHESSSRRPSKSSEDKHHYRDKTPEMKGYNYEKSSRSDRRHDSSRSYDRHKSRSEYNSQSNNNDNFEYINDDNPQQIDDNYNSFKEFGENKVWGRHKKADFWEPGMPTTEEVETKSVRDQYREVYNYRADNSIVYGEHDNFFETHGTQFNNNIQNKDQDRSKRTPTPLLRLEKPTRRRPSMFWDVPPKGYEHITPLQYKAMQAAGQIPTLGGVVPTNTPTPNPPVITLADLPPTMGMNEFTSNFNHNFVPQQGASSLPPPTTPGIGTSTLLTSQLARQARRLYVGNIPFGITEDLLLQFFNEKMHQSGLVSGPGNAITSSQVNHDKNFAFLEFRCVDECTNALVFDGTMLQGQNLRIRRPNGYASLLTVVENNKLNPPPPSIPGSIGFVHKDNPHKLFIGGIPCYLNDGQVQELLLAFGPLQAFNLVKDTVTGVSKGYAFCEYMDHSVTDIAIQGLNGMQLGEKKIVVQRASVGAKNSVYAPASDLSQQLGIPSLAPGVLVLEARTKILCMLNMVIASELINDQEYEDILDDTNTRG